MKLTTYLTFFLATGALASAACVVENVDTDNDIGGNGGTVSTGGSGGDATGGGAEGGAGGAGGAGGGAQGGGGAGQGGGGGEGGGGMSCFDDCDAMYPNGINDYLGWLSCTTCSACYDICDGGTGNVCVSGSELGCSQDFNDCETCVNSACASDVDGNGTTSGVCASELGAVLDNEDAVSLSECYNACP